MLRSVPRMRPAFNFKMVHILNTWRKILMNSMIITFLNHNPAKFYRIIANEWFSMDSGYTEKKMKNFQSTILKTNNDGEGWVIISQWGWGRHRISKYRLYGESAYNHSGSYLKLWHKYRAFVVFQTFCSIVHVLHLEAQWYSW